MNKLWASIIGVGVVVGTAVAIVIMASHKVWGMTLTPEIKPVEVATLSVTIIVAIFIQVYFVSDASNSRVEKDLLIVNVKDALVQLRDCRDTFIRCYESHKITRIDQSKIQSQIRSLGHALDALEISLAKSNCHNLKRQCTNLTSQCLTYKSVVTGGAFPSKPYPSSTYTDHQRIYRQLDVDLQDLIFKINRY